MLWHWIRVRLLWCLIILGLFCNRFKNSSHLQHQRSQWFNEFFFFCSSSLRGSVVDGAAAFSFVRIEFSDQSNAVNTLLRSALSDLQQYDRDFNCLVCLSFCLLCFKINFNSAYVREGSIAREVQLCFQFRDNYKFHFDIIASNGFWFFNLCFILFRFKFMCDLILRTTINLILFTSTFNKLLKNSQTEMVRWILINADYGLQTINLQQFFSCLIELIILLVCVNGGYVYDRCLSVLNYRQQMENFVFAACVLWGFSVCELWMCIG